MFNKTKKIENPAIKQATAEYDSALELLDKLCMIRFPSQKEKKYQELSTCFEEILQGILLITAIQDGTVCVEEWNFLESFTTRVNIMEYLNSELSKLKGKKQKLSLKVFQTVDDETRGEINRLVRESLSKAAQKFYKPFAEVDYIISEIDYLHEFKLHIRRIVRILCEIDGDSIEDERAVLESAAGLKAFYDIIEKYWKSYGEQDKAWRNAINSRHDKNFMDRYAEREDKEK